MKLSTDARRDWTAAIERGEVGGTAAEGVAEGGITVVADAPLVAASNE